MSERLRVIRRVVTLRRHLTQWRQRGDRIALVPTMGALHTGHLSLVKLARRKADRVVVSIFVNPAQFGPGEDLATYPRTFKSDLANLASANIDLVWSPASVSEMYPDGFATRIVPSGPASVGLEDAFRPHFFEGVATVVAKLFIQCMPDFALFGEKDFQQLRVVTRMARDLDLPVQVIGGPTVRERDGLALSSRNVYLSAEERAIAPTLHNVLSRSAEMIGAGRPLGRVLVQGRLDIERAGFKLDYLEARNAETLEPVKSAKDGPLRLLVAARLGRTRLIDNIACPSPGAAEARVKRRR